MHTAKSVTEMRQELARYLFSYTSPNVLGAITPSMVDDQLKTYLSAGVHGQDLIKFLSENRGPHDDHWQNFRDRSKAPAENKAA